MNTELKIGKMTNEELAEWFGLKKNTLENHKKDYLKKLKDYAEFREEKGKVIITEILVPVFDKDSSSNRKKVENNYMRYATETSKGTYLITNTVAAHNLIENEIVEGVCEETVARYNSEALTLDWGTKTNANREYVKGRRNGCCAYEWGKVAVDKSIVLPLTDKEREDMKIILNSVFLTREEEARLAESYHNKEISKKQYTKAMCDGHNFGAVYQKSLEYWDYKFYFTTRATQIDDFDKQGGVQTFE